MNRTPDLVEQNLGLAQVIAFDYSNIPGLSLAEVVSESHSALLRARDSYDAGKGEFTPYAARIIRNSLNSVYAKQLRMARMFPKSLDDPPISQSGQTDFSSGDLALEQSDSRQDVRRNVKRRETQSVLQSILRSLSPRERAVIEQMRLGRSLAEIGGNLGVTKQAVHKVSSPALAKVKEALEAYGYSGLDSQGFLKSKARKRSSSPG